MTGFVIYCMIYYKKLETAQCALSNTIYIIYLNNITETYSKMPQNTKFDIFSQKIVNILTIIYDKNVICY